MVLSFLYVSFCIFLLYLITQKGFITYLLKSLCAFRRRTNFYKAIYVGDGNDSVAGLSGACRLPNQFDSSGLILVEANYFHLHSAVHIAAKLYACFCLVAIIMSTDSQNVT